jgi:hypothetical protein
VSVHSAGTGESNGPRRGAVTMKITWLLSNGAGSSLPCVRELLRDAR